MYYVGSDRHKRTTWFYMVDANGKKCISKNISNTMEELKEFFSEIPQPFTLAVEATYNWYYFVDLAEQYAEKVFLANSYELKAFAKQHKKTDKIDARLIATVLYKGFLPTVAIANRYTREIREVLRYRVKLVQDRTRNISRLKGLLDKLGYRSSGNYTTHKALKEVDTRGLPERYVSLIGKYKINIGDLTTKIAAMKKELDVLPTENLDMSNLLTIPGIGTFSAALIATEIMDVRRFKSFNRLCAYAGLAPRVSASANKIFHGALNKNRRKSLQWILLENVYHFIKADGDRATKFEAIEKRKGHNTAKVALARDFLKIVYRVLKERRPYYIDNKIQSVTDAALVGV